MRTALALFILHYFLFSTSVWGQVLEKITDLDKELKVASTPSQKAILHNKLAYALLDIDITKARICVEKAYKIGQQHNLTTQEAESQWILGQIYRRQLEYKQAKQALEKALRIFKDIQSDLGIQKTQIEMAVLYSDQAMHAKTDSLFAVLSSIISEKYSKDFLHPYLHYCIGVHILRKGEYTRSLEHFRLALTMFEEHNNIFWVARMQNGIGLSYKNIGFKRLALEHYLQALRIYDKLNIEHRGLIVTLTNVGNLYVHSQDSAHYKIAAKYYNRAKKIATKLNEIDEYIEIMNNLGRMYMTHQPETGIAYLDTCLQIAYTNKKKLGVVKIKLQKAEIYIRQKNIVKARKEIFEAIDMSQKHQLLKELINCYMIMGHSYRKQKDYQQALSYYLKTEKIAKDNNLYKELILSYFHLSNSYFEQNDCTNALRYVIKQQEINEQYNLELYKVDAWAMRAKGDSCKGDYQSALKWYMQYTHYKNNMDREKRYNDTQELQYLYDFETQEKESILLKKQNAWQKRDLNNRLTMLVLSLILLLFVGILFFISFYFYKYQKHKNLQIEAHNHELEDANLFKTKLISIIAHDLRRPYTNLLGTLQLIREGALDTEEQQILFNEIEKQTNRTNEFINNLLLWAKAQHNAFKFQPILFDIRILVRNVVELLKHQAEAKGAYLGSDVDEELYIYADMEMLKIVIFNLVTNAIKFTPQQGNIHITQETEANLAYIRIKDTGIGISPENQRKLLEKRNFYTSGTAGESGFGLGLMICYDFVAMNNGKLSFESEAGKGSIFTITLPTQKASD